MKSKKLDNIIIVNGKPMWKKDWKILQKQQKDTVKKYFAIVAPGEVSNFGRIVDEFIYILSVQYNINEKQPFRVYTDDCFITDCDLLDKEFIYEYKLSSWNLNLMKSNKFDYVITDKVRDLVVFKKTGGYNVVDIEKTIEEFNKHFSGIELKLEEKISDIGFQYEHSNISHYNMIIDSGYDEDGKPNEDWTYYLPEDVRHYLSLLNEKEKEKNKTKKLEKVKEYALTEV